MRILYTCILVTMIIGTSSKVTGQEYKRFALELNGGATYPNLDIEGQFNYKVEGGLRFNFTPLLGIRGEVEKGVLEGGKGDPYKRSFVNDYMRYGGKVYMNLGRLVQFEKIAKFINFQVYGGAGVISSSLEDSLIFGDRRLAPYNETDFTYNFGGELQIRLSKAFAINLGATYHLTNVDVLDGYTNTSISNKYNDRFTTMHLGLAIYFGKSGVEHADWVDITQNEELNRKNEANTKAIKKMHDSMEDTDNDGVIDILDQDNATPAGVRVDTKGLPFDTDYDGIPDYLDDCPVEPGTEIGNGCPTNKNDSLMNRDNAVANGDNASGGDRMGGKTGDNSGKDVNLSTGAKYPRGNYTAEEVKNYPVVTLESDKNADPNVEVYYIIGGSFSDKVHAIDYHSYLLSQGFNDSQILFVKERGLFRVSFMKFKDEFSSRQKMEELRKQYNAEAWLLMQ